MFNIPIKLARKQKKMNVDSSELHEIGRKALVLRYQMVCSLLEFYFDAETDKIYIQEKLEYGKAMLENVDKILKPTTRSKN